jgi:hypothetical protein
MDYHRLLTPKSWQSWWPLLMFVWAAITTPIRATGDQVKFKCCHEFGIQNQNQKN